MNNINIKNKSFIAGSISVAGNITVNIDNTSMFYTDVYQSGVTFNVDLTEKASSSPIITIMSNVYNLSYHKTSIIVKVNENSDGSYTILGATSNTQYASYFASLNITIVRDGK